MWEEAGAITKNVYFKRMPFNYSLDYKTLNFRDQPALYRVGRGEQGVLLVEPYKSEIGPHWRFRTPKMAQESVKKIYSLFLDYLQKDDFVGADMARKYLQMGFTRARRYARHKTGRKYESRCTKNGNHNELPLEEDPIKNRSASIFYAAWRQAEANEIYTTLRAAWRKRYG